MKKLYISIITAILCISLTNCSAEITSSEASQSQPEASVTSEEQPAPSEAVSSNGSSSDSNALGTRMNPVPFNQEFSTEYTQNYGTIGYTIKISEALRGQEAVDEAVRLNKYNIDNVSEGMDLILFKVDFKLDTYIPTDPNDSFLCSVVYCSFFDDTYSEIETCPIAGMEDLHAELYEGGSTSGWLAIQAPAESEHAFLRFDDTTWLQIC